MLKTCILNINTNINKILQNNNVVIKMTENEWKILELLNI